MNVHLPRRALLAAVVVLGLAGAACSLILDSEKDQCASNADCEKLGPGLTCASGVCVSGAADGGPPGNGDSGGQADASDAACSPKEPKVSREEFLNEPCTDSRCIPYDNCQKLGLCGDDAALPALMDPPDGGV